ncbi:MAG: hypothetical protein HKN35_08080 [Woeseia sp.]|nr:hypothetical protein [Woeseia sp.]
MTIPALASTDELSGEVTIGARNVSVSGARNKYQEDINLEDGVRVSDVSLVFVLDKSDALQPDRIELDAHNLGGDPYENMRLKIRKFGAYKFQAQRRRSAWFYDDIIVLPENASIEGSTGGDFHRFDIERVRDDVALTVNLNERADLTMGYERYAKTGSSTTTEDISRDEFELDKPVDELMETLRVGFDYRWSNTHLSLEERVHDYENDVEMFLPGFSAGENPDDLTSLDFYFLNRPYSFSGHDHIARIFSRPAKRLSVSGMVMLGNLDLETRVDERLQGSDFTGQPLQSADSGDGGISRDTVAIDARVRYTLNEQLGLLAGIRQRRLDQSGTVGFSVTEGGQGQWDIDSLAFDLGLAWQAAESLLVSAGWQTQSRDVDSTATQAGGTARTVTDRSDADGLFINFDYRPNNRLHVNARLNDHSRDDPYSLASPSEFTRYRLRASYRAPRGVLVVASHASNERENDLGQWAATTRQTSLRFSHSVADLTWSVGGTLVDNSQDFIRQVSGGSRQDLFDVAYRAETSYADASLSWSVNERWTVGGYWRRYDNSGSFDVSRDDWRTFFDVKLAGNYSIGVSYRNINFEEGGLEFYDAHVIEAGFRIRL